MYDPYGLGEDPLVTPPPQGFGGWWSRLWKTLGRSWKQLALIIAVTSGLPALVFSLISSDSFSSVLDEMRTRQQEGVTGFPPDLITLYATLIGTQIVSAYLSAVGWGASIWTVTRQAAGMPAPFGQAMGYGLKNSLRIFGWLLLYGLMIGLGAVCCVLPGIYFALAGSMIVPLVIFSRGSISDSFRMVNKNFGAVLGRVLLVFAITLAVGLIGGVASGVFGAAMPTSGALAVSGTISAVLSIPTEMLLIVGILLTFAELRAREMPTTTTMLAQAL
jgi:hypothetical protein